MPHCFHHTGDAGFYELGFFRDSPAHYSPSDPPLTPIGSLIVVHTRWQDDRGEAIKVAETVQYFITAMDGVRLEQRAVDELTPMLSDIMTRCVGGLAWEWGERLGSRDNPHQPRGS